MNTSPNNDQKTALITTSTGQDSFFLSKHLKNQGYLVVGLQGGTGPTHSTFDSVLPFNFLNTDSLIQFLQKNQVDEIYNLAAKSSVANSWAERNSYFETNFYAVKRMFDEIVKSDLRNKIKILQIGSTDMLGVSKVTQPFRIGKSWSPYGESKLLAHFEAIRVRDLGVYCSTAVLTNHDSVLRPPHFVIPTLARQACQVIKKKTESIELANWNTTRDWAHAEDCTRALSIALQFPEPEDFLIGTGVSMSLLELAESIRLRYQIDFKNINSSNTHRLMDFEKIWLDANYTKKLLNWQPSYLGPETLFSIVDAYLSGMA